MSAFDARHLLGPDERALRARLAEISRDPALARPQYGGGNITERMAAAARNPAFAGVASRLEIDEASLGRLAKACLELYLATGSFTALHAVTALHALRGLAPRLPDTRDALRWTWRAVAAAFLTIGAPAMRPRVFPPAPGWDEVKAAAVRSNDDHVIKLAYTCLEEWRHYGDERYRLAAALKCGLVRAAR